MSDDPFTHFDLPGDPVPIQEVPLLPAEGGPRRRGPRPGTKRGPRTPATKATVATEKRGAAPPVALYAEVFGALAQPEAKAVATIVQSFSAQSQAAIAQAILKLTEK